LHFVRFNEETTMLHNDRRWCVSDVESAENLALKLTETTWCCCTAFEIGDYAFLNDSTSPDGAQEYAIVRRDRKRLIQIESITFGWCDEAKSLEYVRDILAGRYNRSDFARSVRPILETPDTHGRCEHCA
jgi:hypothetical protein